MSSVLAKYGANQRAGNAELLDAGLSEYGSKMLKLMASGWCRL